jgi:hypothetical protein
MSYVSPFTGTVVQQTDVTYYELNFEENTQLYWPLVVNPTQVPAARIMDCYALAADLSILLPNASQGSTGTDIFMRNYGDTPFYVEDFDGNTQTVIEVGEVKYFYLSDNNTAAGVWQNITFGTGTSGADASTLAGPGLTTYGSRLAVTEEIVQVTSPPTITNADRAKVYVWSGGNGTITLPTAASLSSGWFIAFRNSGSGRLIIAGQGLSQINSTSAITANPGNSGYIIFQQSTGNFFTVGLSTPSNVSFSSVTYDVDAVAGNTLNLVSFAPIIQTYVALSGTRTATLNVLLPGTTQIYYVLNSTGTSAYNVTFQVSGSSQPPIVVPNGTAATILSDGNYLYALTQVAVNNFYGQDGSAIAPPFTFTNDTITGMYLAGSGILGFTANGVEMLNIDNSNTALPVISTPAEFEAKLIAGGTF